VGCTAGCFSLWDGISGTNYVISGSVTLNGVGLANVILEAFPGNRMRRQGKTFTVTQKMAPALNFLPLLLDE